jgi:putative nucleotidyltransferase with HDIG domain
MISREECISLLSHYAGGASWSRHCFAVADAATKVGTALAAQREVNAEFLWSAALLHDIGRHFTHDPVGHGVEGYNLLVRLGHMREAFVCAAHVLFGLDASEAKLVGLPDRDFIPHTVEDQIVSLVDLLIEHDQPTTLAHRFASLHLRNAGNEFFLSRLDRARGRAEMTMNEFNRTMDQSVEQIIRSRGGARHLDQSATQRGELRQE